jgi:hypothetical protein
MIDHIPDPMVKAVLIFGNWIGGLFVVAGAAILAQATFDNLERGVVGATILAAGTLIIRWVLRTSERVEEIWSNAVATAERRAEEAEKRCEGMTLRSDHERQLRISLEECGLVDRRHHLDADPEPV